MEDFFKDYIDDLYKALNEIDVGKLENIVNIINIAREEGKKVFLIGNGGSAATPSHSAGDWSKELKIKTTCLTDNPTLVTAWANDTSYDNIFKAQLETYLEKGDVVIAYSGSGNSPNVLNAVEYAKTMGCTTIGITGNYNGMKGGALAKIADVVLVFPTLSMERIEDCQLIINHIIKEFIKHYM